MPAQTPGLIARVGRDTMPSGQAPVNPFSVGNALLAHIESSGMPIFLKNILPATSKVRACHEDLVAELGQSLKSGWNPSYSMIVVVQGTRCRVVDGMHRHTALMRLLEKKIITDEYPVQCTVLREDTPPNILMALAGKTNLDNETFQKMTVADRAYFLVGAFREGLRQINAPHSADCLWVVSRPTIQTLLQEGSGAPVNISTGASVMDGLVALVRAFVTAHDVAHWGALVPPSALYASVWQNISLLNERGSEWWCALYEKWSPFISTESLRMSGEGPTQDQYAQELKRNGLATYASLYPGVCNDPAYLRKNLEKLGPKHMRPQYEFLWQRIGCHFLLTAKAPSKSFTEAVAKMGSAAPDTQEGELYALWRRASDTRKAFDSNMASTIWFPVRNCDWPGCPGDDTTEAKKCDACDPATSRVYHACAGCSKIAALREVWTEARLTKVNADSKQEPLTICPVCAVALLTRTRHVASESKDLLRLAWPVQSARAEPGGKKDCITCFVGFGCLAHEEKQFWSKAPGEYKVEDTAMNQQEWFNAQHPMLTSIFANLSNRNYLIQTLQKVRTAREIEIKIALGCSDVGAMAKELDPTHQTKIVKPAAGVALPSSTDQESALSTKLAFYEQLLLSATPSGPNRPLKIEHTSWQKWWESAKRDEAEKGRRSFIYLDPMYDDIPTTSDFELMREMINYVSTPGAIVLIFHGFMHLAHYANELSKQSARKNVRYLALFILYAPVLGSEMARRNRTTHFQARRLPKWATQEWQSAAKHWRIRNYAYADAARKQGPA